MYKMTRQLGSALLGHDVHAFLFYALIFYLRFANYCVFLITYCQLQRPVYLQKRQNHITDLLLRECYVENVIRTYFQNESRNEIVTNIFKLKSV